MTLNNQFVDRGKVGNTPALTTRADETFMDYISDMRNFLMHAPYKRVTELSEETLRRTKTRNDQWPKCADPVRDALSTEPEVATWLRAKRTLQEAYWARIMDSYNQRGGTLKQKLDAADKSGPGSVKWDPNFPMPEYATVDIHIQPGGYVNEDLGGFYYDYGTKVFFGGVNDGDARHTKMAEKTALPKDGNVSRTLDLGTGIGQLPVAIKRLFPKADVWAIDIGAPMVRYAHLRAMEQGVDVNFVQMASEKLDFPSGHFDLVTAHLLFHEIPLPIIEATVREAFRVLRPGGTFVIWDFASVDPGKNPYAGFARTLDAADNGEPYSVEFVNCNIEKLGEQTGFKLRYAAEEDIARHGRVLDKPAA
ncbi:MAG: class I SAM-dependent methyltransferase [Rhodospirillaceae bacterium]|nr:class I SAM-dependent methyltransferase [Rhodospirillaceae bacterium]